MKLAFFAAAAAACLCVAAPATAATITFNDVDPNSGLVLVPTYTSAGMIFTAPAGGTSGGLLFFPPDVNPTGSTNIDPGGASILGDPLRLEVDGGGTFDLLGFTFGAYATGGPLTAGHIDVRFQYDDGTDTTESFDTNTSGPEVISLTRTNLRRVTWLGGSMSYDLATCGGFCNHTGTSTGSFTMDNIVVDNLTHSENPGWLNPPPVSVAPEPATWALMLAGFGGAGALLRRRRPALA